MKNNYSIGVDYGTNSVRAVVCDTADGRVIGTSVFNYPTGRQGIILDKKDPNLARQHPADWLKGLQVTVRGAMKQAGRIRSFKADRVAGIGVDATGSTPLPVDARNRPLAMRPGFKKDLAALAWLWKDHTAAAEAEKITALAAKHRTEYLKRCGGTYSSEWFWSKIWHCRNTSPNVFKAACSWVESADFIPAVLCGVTDPAQIVRGACAAGHKGMYADVWGGLPDKKFLKLLHPDLAALRDRLFEAAWDTSEAAGQLCPEWAEKLGLPAGIPVAVGVIDAHAGAVGAGVGTGIMVKVIGTSACDLTVLPKTEKLKDIPGVCGIVDGSILPGFYGIEAGQPAVGDIFKWFVETVCEGDDRLHGELTRKAEKLKPGQSGLLALDWNNGNRSILVDPKLSGLLLGQTLYTTRAEIYRALIEATAFGARTIIDRMTGCGVPVKKVVCCGGIAEKNAMLMQIYADVTGCVIQVSASDQACALGSALAAAVAAGHYKTFAAAQKKMTRVRPRQFRPRAAARRVYDRLYGLYRQVHDAFGVSGTTADLSGVMKELALIRDQQSR